MEDALYTLGIVTTVLGIIAMLLGFIWVIGRRL